MKAGTKELIGMVCGSFGFVFMTIFHTAILTNATIHARTKFFNDRFFAIVLVFLACSSLMFIGAKLNKRKSAWRELFWNLQLSALYLSFALAGIVLAAVAVCITLEGRASLSQALQIVWLGICIYTGLFFLFRYLFVKNEIFSIAHAFKETSAKPPGKHQVPAPNSRVGWYSLNRELETVNHKPVNLKQALFIVDEYFKRWQQHYEWAEDSLAASMFGFQKTEDEFIELSIDSPSEISLKYEIRIPKKTTFGDLHDLEQKEKKLTSQDNVKQAVSQFFTMSPDEFLATF